MTETGEYLVGAYLRLVEECDFVDYNVRLAGGGLEGLREIDVIGLNFDTHAAFICEVITHLSGTLYRSHDETVNRVEQKYAWARRYAETRLVSFTTQQFQLWAPYVTPKLEQGLKAIDPGLVLVINDQYRSRVEELMGLARLKKEDVGNPFFRGLQIIQHLRGPKNRAGAWSWK